MTGRTFVVVARDADGAGALHRRLVSEGCTVMPGDDRASGARPARLLAVEHDPRQRQLLERAMLTPGRPLLEVAFADSVEEACRLIQAERFACVVLRHRLRDGLGVDVLDAMDDALLTTPVVALSDVDDPVVAVSYWRRGCTEFIAPWDVFEPDSLRRRITEAMSRFHRRALATIIDRGHLGRGIIDSQEDLIALARTDRLLGICNRAVFDDMHADYHERARGGQAAYALAMIDLDRFKAFNDRFGHAAGDECLRAVATALAAEMREGDLIARYGGEELAVLLTEADPGAALARAEALRARVESLALPHAVTEHAGRVTVSIGLAWCDGHERVEAAAILRRADEALYRAKRCGRNRIETAEPAPGAAIPSPA
jgi:diguanylate cyclase (GGDEF)-like protein